MFLNIDVRDTSSVAAIDDSGEKISYGDLVRFSKDFLSITKKRTLIFILSENVIGSLVGYVASIENKIVPLVINCEADTEDVISLIEKYKPEYIWLPLKLENKFKYKNIYENYGFVLLKTGLDTFELYEELSLLLPTSGSTGSPKLVRHSYTNVSENAKNVANFFNLSVMDKAMAILPMHYTMGLSVVSSHLFAGATVLLSKINLTDKNFWNYLKKEKATSFTGVPFSFEILYRLRFFRMNLPDLKLITQGGGKLSKELFAEFAEFAANTGKQFIATYGQTEGTARMAYLPAEKAIEKIGSIGKAIPEGKLFLINEEGLEVEEADIEGELVYEGPNVTLGYALTGKDLIKGDVNKGILSTGDRAVKDMDGYYYIVGRSSRFLKLYGTRINLDELQELISFKYGTECICTGNDKKMTIYIKDIELIESVKNFVVEKTRIFHGAFEVLFINKIPRNAIGKIIYNA